MQEELSLDNIKRAAERIAPYVITTPAHHWNGIELYQALGEEQTQVYVKLELLQITGTFKPRGALNVMLSMTQEQLARGVTAVSAGNHAIATAFAARKLGTTSKVVMPRTANSLRVRLSRDYGAEVVFAENTYHAHELVLEIEREEGRTFVHPYDGPLTAQGTATAGLEFSQQVPELDAMILPVGGGGLCAGFASALKQIWPKIRIYAVEPQGANSMYLSFNAGSPQALESIQTIADSLAPPHAEPYSFSVCQQVIDELVLISDQQIKEAMRLLFMGMKLAVEPAGAAATAALLGPLYEKVKGKRVGIICCGANITPSDYLHLINS